MSLSSCPPFSFVTERAPGHTMVKEGSGPPIDKKARFRIPGGIHPMKIVVIRSPKFLAPLLAKIFGVKKK